ncbi:MAG: aminotransferase class III-fold pyridoxal phosphate-dependent enzyme [Pseudomonadota bacterium]
MELQSKLDTLRHGGAGKRRTVGLDDETIARFARQDPRLEEAVDAALSARECWQAVSPDLFDLDEQAQIERMHDHVACFYPDGTVNPYVALGAKGPWIVTSLGAVLYDCGGYGMLGAGHAPDHVLRVLGAPHVMANVMTPSPSQMRLVQLLREEIGHSRDGGCPFESFLFLNSGSESMSVGARIADMNAKVMTDLGGRHAGKPIRSLSLRKSFHGRTDRPAQFSDSTRETYEKHLASYRKLDSLLTVTPNDVDELRAVFRRADDEGFFIEALFMEPVMGEGNPGMAITPEFYRAARELTLAHGSLLLVDSIQAGLRVQGCLSIVDYPGFQGEQAPDLETYSKAVNAGQFPLSVLAFNQRAQEIQRPGIYGNTMTTNPKALDVAAAVLSSVTPELRANIRERGREAVELLEALRAELGPELVTGVQGTGLLFSLELSDAFKCYGHDSTEEYLRLHGVNVIHGGRNSLRYTPQFSVTSEELQLVVAATRDALLNGPRVSQDEARRAVG